MEEGLKDGTNDSLKSYVPGIFALQDANYNFRFYNFS